MGWFDSDDKEATGAPTPAQPQAAAPARRSPAAAPTGGSTLGAQLQVKGTIVADEQLTIIGRVEGTVHARQALLIAREAEIEATVNGTRIKVEGKVKGDVNASESLVLGPTAQIHGNLSTPSLQVQEGAYFKGAVEMKAKPEPARAEAPRPEPVKAAAKTPVDGGTKAGPTIPKPAAAAAHGGDAGKAAGAAAKAEPVSAKGEPVGTSGVSR